MRRRNSVYGSTERDRDHLGGNPRRNKSGRSGVLLGSLVELVLADGRTLRAGALKSWYLCWAPGTNDLRVVKRSGKSSVSALSQKDRTVFKQFHKSQVENAGRYHWPEPCGLRRIGRLKSLTYVVPEWVRSPEKHGYRWVHEFGDHGERGHGAHEGSKGYPTRLMPVLCQASNGSLHIKRVPGNRYDVSSWIFW
jgi:hypothetical protein